MSEIGRLTPLNGTSLSRFVGTICTLDKRYTIRLDGDEALTDSHTPSHRIYAKGGGGQEIEIGSAWLKTAKHGQYTGKPFLSVTIDYPGLPAPLNVAAFPDIQGHQWIVAWRRRKSNQTDAV